MFLLSAPPLPIHALHCIKHIWGFEPETFLEEALIILWHRLSHLCFFSRMVSCLGFWSVLSSWLLAMSHSRNHRLAKDTVRSPDSQYCMLRERVSFPLWWQPPCVEKLLDVRHCVALPCKDLRGLWIQENRESLSYSTDHEGIQSLTPSTTTAEHQQTLSHFFSIKCVSLYLMALEQCKKKWSHTFPRAISSVVTWVLSDLKNLWLLANSNGLSWDRREGISLS